MANTYTPNVKLAIPGDGDRGWGATLAADLAALDGLACVASLAVTPAESPSTSLNVRVVGGTYRGPGGLPTIYAGTSSYSIPASSATALWLTATGSLASGSTWPTAGPYVPLAVVTSGVSTIATVGDSRAATTTVGPPTLAVATVATNYAVGWSDDVLRINASGGPVTVTLPAANAVPGRVLRFLKIDSTTNAVTLSAPSPINSGTTLAISTQYQAKTLVADAYSNTWGVY